MSKPGPNREILRLSKLMSERGLCSRREADEWIRQGWVKVDGKVVDQLGTKVDRQVEIELSREARREKSSLVSLILNKPVGYVSAQAEKDYTPAICLLQKRNSMENKGLNRQQMQGLAVVGRLDIDSKGLLLFSQDGSLVKKVIGPDSRVEKEYLVWVSGDTNQESIQMLRHGLKLDGKKLKPAKVKLLRKGLLQFVLVEGKKRQIRRMCELVGLEIKALKRMRIGQVRLGKLPEGKWRFLSPSELRSFN